MNTEFEIGDKVAVNDPGLARLYSMMKSMGHDVKPNNVGWVDSILDDGDIMVKFPIGDEDPDDHSQVAPYPKHMVYKTEW